MTPPMRCALAVLSMAAAASSQITIQFQLLPGGEGEKSINEVLGDLAAAMNDPNSTMAANMPAGGGSNATSGGGQTQQTAFVMPVMMSSCPPGFSGSSCQYNTNECLSYPCQNGGTCADMTDQFRCTCMSGFSSDPDRFEGFQTANYTGTCEYEIDECSSSPCVNGATCIDAINTYHCTCDHGWNGYNCNHNMPECDSRPCMNGGTCNEATNRYTCTCDVGWAGYNCDVNKDECHSYPCINGATCIDYVETNYACLCAAGYSGAQCHVDIDECASRPCQNGATCVDSQVRASANRRRQLAGGQSIVKSQATQSATIGADHYVCDCGIGFTGPQGDCEVDIDECASKPCKNGAICDQSGAPVGNRGATVEPSIYRCTCQPGYRRENCDIEVNECLRQNCKNGATCIDKINAYACLCPSGYAPGALATIKATGYEYWNIIDLQMGVGDNMVGSGNVSHVQKKKDKDDPGSLYQYTKTSFTADGAGTLSAAIKEANCQIDVEDCLSFPCMNGATCVDQEHDFKCLCVNGFVGKHCETMTDNCGSLPCKFGSTCTNGVHSFSCTCAKGYMSGADSTCEIDIDECQSSPCTGPSGGMYAGQVFYKWQRPNQENNLMDSFNKTHDGRLPMVLTALTPDKVKFDPQNAIANQFNMSKVLTFLDERVEGNDGHYFEAVDGAAGDLAAFELELQQITLVARILIKNGVGGSHKRRGTRDYDIHTRAFKVNPLTGEDEPWVLYRSGTLNDMRTRSFLAYETILPDSTLAPNRAVPVDGGIFARYIKFTMKTHYGDGVALNGMIVQTARTYCHSHGQDKYSCDCPRGFSGRLTLDPWTKKPEPGLQDCSLDYDECANNPCMNGGKCHQGSNNFYCVCAPGFFGGTGATWRNNRCGSDINECASHPCSHGQCQASLPDKPDMYECNCDAGYSGYNCDIASGDTCKLYGENGCDKKFAVCNSIGPGQHTCTCIPGYTTTDAGVTCLAVDECSSSPCKNKGVCVDEVDTYHCDCWTNNVTGVPISGYEGYNCETDIDECSPTCTLSLKSALERTVCARCQFNSTAVCLESHNSAAEVAAHGKEVLKPGAYACICKPGWEHGGTKRCEKDINECVNPNPCSYGTCSESYGNPSVPVNEYRCACSAGWQGTNCADDIDECKSAPCKNGGKCRDSTTASTQTLKLNAQGVSVVTSTIKRHAYTCKCKPGFHGTNCDTDRDECGSTPCKHGSICTAGVDSFKCTCATGYSNDNNRAQTKGNICDHDINECASDPCKTHRGHCFESTTSLTGQNVPPGQYICKCDAGFTGDNCETDIDECETLRPCFNGGVCHQSTVLERITHGAFLCVCKDGFNGKVCANDINECDSNPCQNLARCSQFTDGFSCGCRNGYSGDECESDIDECVSRPCRNSWSSDTKTHHKSACFEGVDSYSCVCAAGFTGFNCESDINECASNPCMNSATCSDTTNNRVFDTYNCKCENGFAGTNCNQDIDECLSLPCEHNGLCEEATDYYDCKCSPGWQGYNCAKDFNECNSSPCQNAGNCKESLSTGVAGGIALDHYVCTCTPGYTGTDCKIDIDECASLPCKFSVTKGCSESSTSALSIPADQYVCTCAVGYTGDLVKLKALDHSFDPVATKTLPADIPCEHEINECLSTPCKNGGVCDDEVGNYTCHCDTTNGRFAGHDCEVRKDLCDLVAHPHPGTPVCHKDANCDEKNAKVTCTCMTGYRANDTVASQPTPLPAPYNKDKLGTSCELIDTCCSVQGGCKGARGVQGETATCGLHGACMGADKLGPTRFVCTCDAGWNGTKCGTNINECASQPCQNEGTCLADPAVVDAQGVKSTKYNAYACTCVEGFSGENCATDIDECASKPCASHSMCTQDGVGHYKCLCNAGWKHGDTGDQHCDVDVNECTTNPCAFTDDDGRTQTKALCVESGMVKDGSNKTIAGGLDAAITKRWKMNEKGMDLVFNGPKPEYGNEAKLWSCDAQVLCIAACDNRAAAVQGKCKTRCGSYYGGKCAAPGTFFVMEDKTTVVEVSAADRARAEAVGRDKFTCLCEPGWHGDLCNEDMDDCQSSPCKNGAVCIDKTGFFECNCKAGYTKENDNLCGTDTDECRTSPCGKGASAHGKCVESGQTLALKLGSCKHPAKDVLNPDPRKRDTTINFCYDTCTNLMNTGVEFYKVCGGCCAELNSAWGASIKCHQDAPDWASATAWTNGFTAAGDPTKCVNVKEAVPANTFVCHCKAGWSGPLCNTDVNECASNPCQNGATCQDSQTHFSAALGGKLLVGNDGIKPMWGADVYHCTCPLGVNGTNCENDKDECLSTPCLHGGVCMATGGELNVYKCLCLAGFTGDNCGEIIDDCASQGVVCIKGKCAQDFAQVGKIVCHCETGYQGRYCDQSVGGCTSAPCERGAQCSNYLDGNYKCHCEGTGFTGSNCNRDVDECVSSPCQNGATCKQSGGLACSCLDDPMWHNRWGNCKDYGPGKPNHPFCDRDSGYNAAREPVLAKDGCCSACGGDCSRTDNSTQTTNETRIAYNQYTCTCPVGFKGADCEIDIDECVSNPCQSHGTQDVAQPSLCYDSSNRKDVAYGAYMCLCALGYSGDNCETDQNECKDAKCQNAIQGVQCVDGSNSYRCVCPNGLKGVYCEIDTDECASNPCGFGHGCVDSNVVGSVLHNSSNGAGLDKFSCACTYGMTGANCNVDINECDSSPCLNAATCFDSHNNTGKLVVPVVAIKIHKYACTCEAGYVGSNCQVDIDECESSPCDHAAVCAQAAAAVDAYSCSCLSGYAGFNCNLDVDECISLPCLHGKDNAWGGCIDHVAFYRCDCAVGWHGHNCDLDKDECVSAPCKKGATCVDSSSNPADVPINRYACLCVDGFVGGMCNGTHYEALGLLGYAAQCGTLRDCVNSTGAGDHLCGGECVIEVNECGSAPCTNGGSCTQGEDSYTCECMVGYIGSNCETDFDECSSKPCKEADGLYGCIESGTSPKYNPTNIFVRENYYTCNCSRGWTGHVDALSHYRTDCNTNVKECDSAPCQNGGTCLDSIDAFACICSMKFSGTLCQEDINPCVGVENDCDKRLTRGTPRAECQHLGPGSHKCMCVVGFEPDVADKLVLPRDEMKVRNCSEINECLSNPCMNGATCAHALDYYTCSCAAGFAGMLCDANQAECNSVPCRHGGICTDFVDHYECACAEGYGGENCATDIDECASNPCQNGGTCRDSALVTYSPRVKTNSFHCDCVAGWEDNLCQTDKNECLSAPCLNGATCKDSNYNSVFGGKNQQPVPAFMAAGIFLTPVLINEFRCYCASGYAAGVCQPPPNKYIAQYNTSCQDAAGAEGTSVNTICNVDINECASNPCAAGSGCTHQLDAYTCTCIGGLTGDNCDVDLNECDSTPCKNQGECVDSTTKNYMAHDSYHCTCSDGWGGENCEGNVDECKSAPCQNGATCSEAQGAVLDRQTKHKMYFMCSCSGGWTGRLCDIDINECASHPCTCTLNSTVGAVQKYQSCKGVCRESSQAHSTVARDLYVCDCKDGYNGDNCETDLDECISQPCRYQDDTCNRDRNSPRCAATKSVCASGDNAYTCDCPAGFAGTRCEIDVDECLSNPCQNGATCSHGLNTYACNCTTTGHGSKIYTGDQCQAKINACDEARTLLCGDHSICTPTNVGAHYKCQCEPGFRSENGAQSDCFPVCKGDPCKNGGTCVEEVYRRSQHSAALSRYMCNCVTGFYGNDCQNDFDECESNPCKNGAVCSDSTKEYLGRFAGETGADAWLSGNMYTAVEFMKEPTNVTNVPIDWFKCTCADGWTHESNATHFDKTADRDALFTSIPWIQHLAGTYNKTKGEPYGLGGTCDWFKVNRKCYVVNSGGSPLRGACQFSCPVTHENCHVDINECSSKPCQHTFKDGEEKHICRESKDSPAIAKGAYTCDCFKSKDGKAWFEGHNCETDMDECVSAPCQNKGMCSESSCPLGVNNYDGGVKRCNDKAQWCAMKLRLTSNAKYVADCTSSACTAWSRNCSIAYKAEKPQIAYNAANGNWIGDEELSPGKYSCLCPQGFDGANCDQDFDECSSRPCGHGATCADSNTDATVGVFRFQCKCPPGREGDDCTKDVDECLSNPCQNGGKCIESSVKGKHVAVDFWKCECPTSAQGIVGWIGEVCDKSLDECLSFPCGPHGTCQDYHRGYNCTCETGWTGDDCEIDYNECGSFPCGDGKCHQTIDAKYFCECPEGYMPMAWFRDIDNVRHGTDCAANVNDCASSPCQNGATCTDGVSAFTCTCAEGFEGAICDTQVNPCTGADAAKLQCDQYSNCVHDGPGKSHCTCHPGYRAYAVADATKTCYEIDECSEQKPCFNGAKCNDKLSNFNCTCAAGYLGNLCKEDIDECFSAPCKNGAVCSEGVDSYSCTCAPGFTQFNCDKDINECESSPCQNGGSGGWKKSGCYESSFPGYYPTSTGTVPEVGNRITIPENHYFCFCVAGFTGKSSALTLADHHVDNGNCETDVNECDPSPCMNGATCSQVKFNTTNQGYKCDCVTGTTGLKSFGYDGVNCANDINECFSAPCQNGGLCAESNTDSLNYAIYLCTCATGYQGENCETDYDECSSNPCSCKRGGVDCHGQCLTAKHKANKYECKCKDGYTGERCEVDNDECNSHPCALRGVCDTPSGSNLYGTTQGKSPVYNNGRYDDGVNKYRCICSAGWKGINCLQDENECSSAPCKNGGTCTDGDYAYTCACRTETSAAGTHVRTLFTGHDCEKKTNACSNADQNHCDDNADCNLIPGATGLKRHKCVCKPMYFNVVPTNLPSFAAEKMGGKPGCNRYCASNPCLNGATCIDKARNFECKCAPGYAPGMGVSGGRCQTNEDECDVPGGRCYNGGTCEDLEDHSDYANNGGFVCHCVEGFKGLDCNSDITECNSNPCMNGATCLDSAIDPSVRPGSFRCKCPTGFGRMVVGGWKATLTRGERPLAFTGEYCETDVDECSSNPCAYGSCSTVLARGGTGDYKCTCDLGYTNTAGHQNCIVDKNECDSRPCKNEGSCKESNSRGSSISADFFTCTCNPGYAGSLCETDSDECFSTPCKNGALCIEGEDSYTCDCSPPSIMSADPAVNTLAKCKAMCVAQGGHDCAHVGFNAEQKLCTIMYKCMARPVNPLNGLTYIGNEVHASKKDLECTSSKCTDATVPGGAAGNKNCKGADIGFRENKCQSDRDECDSSPCQNGATCTNGVGIQKKFPFAGVYVPAYQCTCTAGWGVAGDHDCVTDINECLSNPCQNGGTCQDSSTDKSVPINEYVCVCMQGYRGNVVQKPHTKCGVPASLINGACHADGTSFLRKCPNKLTGTREACPRCVNTYGCGNCEVDQNECSDFWLFDAAPCKRGTCVESTHDKTVDIGDVKCNCPPGYTGKICHIQTMILTIKQCSLALTGQSSKALRSRDIAMLLGRVEYEARMINGKTSKRGTQECSVEIKPNKCPDETSECPLNAQDRDSLIQVLKMQNVKGEVQVIDEDGYVPVWVSSDDDFVSKARASFSADSQKTSNTAPVVDDGTSFPIIIIALLVAIAALGVIGVVCVKHKQNSGGGKAEPAHVEMEVI